MEKGSMMRSIERMETVLREASIVKIILFIVPVSMLATLITLFTQDVYRTVVYTLLG
ncbi:hypothetical protein B0H94_11438 [Salsuginibacillus halophilus]|uniref:Uncharacterized protein n=1 Tax=Salsuginibacillus halophilus TaxID=517424 RepID=A0A2P8H8N1_9BACI|nr:hypothetical protein [Salsuginibacillus halophilus]PSL42564.1 hypothetical protein B0H94_11438 [Salsuginibacillus halophilus]